MNDINGNSQMSAFDVSDLIGRSENNGKAIWLSGGSREQIDVRLPYDHGEALLMNR